MRKIAFLIPAGEIYNHDRVRSYHWGDIPAILNANINVGDTFVFEATLRLLKFDEVLLVPTFISDFDRTLAEVNECDFAILRGSNYVHSHMDWGDLPRLIELMKIPLIPFGIGGQAPRYETVNLTPSSIRTLQMIGSRCAKVGVRGAFTAEILKSHGISNIEVIGCPSLMRLNKPEMNIKLPNLQDNSKIGFTVTRGFEPMYSEDIARTIFVQTKILRNLASLYDVHILSQGESIEKRFFYEDLSTLDDDIFTMKRQNWIYDNDDIILKLYKEKMFFGVSPEEYDEKMQDLDFVIGTRLHGNIIFLSNEKPAVYLVYDSRTRELADHFQIPSWDVMNPAEFDLDRFLTSDRFDRFNRRYVLSYKIMSTFLDENSIPHRMTPIF